MTQNRRIILNIAATYGRSLFNLACGLFTARWILNSLGDVDYGLYGLVGGLTIFITFFNGLMAGATARFYAFSVGAAKVAKDAEYGLEECRAWFNTALMIHTILPILLISVGYLVGYKIVTEYLTIPLDRMEVCIWVLRFVAITCFVSMLDVPFRAMYTAKQYIAELTIYSVAQTICNFFVTWYMIEHPGQWLFRYAAYMCILQIMPQIIICIRAWKVFPECRLNFDYWWNWRRVRQMWSYAGWNAFAGVGTICRGQGMAILVNKYFGPQINASMSISNHVSSHAQTLTAAMLGAFSPAITTLCGAKEYDRMRVMAFRACKFGMLFVLIFVVPLTIELREVMTLWLKNPPPYSIELCACMLWVLVIDKSSIGHMLAVNANGKVAMYQGFLGTALILTLPIAWGLMVMKVGVLSVGYAFLVATALSAWGRVFFARKLVGMSAKYWLGRVVAPVLVVSVASLLSGSIPRLFMNPCFARIVVSTFSALLAMLPAAWLVVLDDVERGYVKSRLLLLIERMRGN